jgi:hypothetical protein
LILIKGKRSKALSLDSVGSLFHDAELDTLSLGENDLLSTTPTGAN